MCLPRIWWRLRVGIIQILKTILYGAEVIKLIIQTRNICRKSVGVYIYFILTAMKDWIL
jgi:hypothetical protein